MFAEIFRCSMGLNEEDFVQFVKLSRTVGWKGLSSKRLKTIPVVSGIKVNCEAAMTVKAASSPAVVAVVA